MKIQVLGGHGGLAKGFLTTSFLIDDVLLIDAGAVANTLSVDEQIKIQHILISHYHLDHIKDLAFISDNCFGLRDRPFAVYTHSTVKDVIKSHLLNDVVWPDFTILPTPENPTMKIYPIKEEEKIELGDYKITPVKVNHVKDSMGFIIEKDESSVLFTSDTGPTERIWEMAHTFKNLKAIFTEVSFPSFLGAVAEVSQHHTPSSIKNELSKMPQQVPIILTHLKPHYRKEIVKEISDFNESRIHILECDGEIFHF
jgi:ribonuclease BN (tRNA processing enzyme)